YRFYHDLLSCPELGKTAQKYGYEICYFPHFNMMATNDYFEDVENIRLIEDGREYKKYFSEAALWITDYSSTAFDFAYLGKPVVYCQSDKKEFFGSHTYTEGYFDYEKDGFGEVVYDVDSAVSTICDYMKNDCKIKDKYSERIDNTFAYRDRNNSLRVTEAIKERVNEK
ncbi:MAG: CDP-glycerol glycerophosphotransferase family protein, partial [Clostridia bacterium]|nr:CDP-glycerol glycerophosphotransferase family protein [Clostridia bacterium]